MTFFPALPIVLLQSRLRTDLRTSSPKWPVQVLKEQLFDAKIWLTRHDTMDAGVSRFNPLLWPKPPLIWRYGIAILSVIVAVIIASLPALHLQMAPVSLFLCAVMLSAWFGELGPGLLATALSALAFLYYFVPPIYSFTAKPEEMPRVVIFVMSALFVGLLSAGQRRATESLRRSRDDLKRIVQELNNTNEKLRAESVEREHVQNDLRRSQAYLAEAQRLSHTGSLGWRPSTGEIIWSQETFRIFQYDCTITPTVELFLQRVHPEDVTLAKETLERASQDGKNFEQEYRLAMPNGSVKHVHVVAQALRDESGSLEFVGAVMDITVTKEVEETLRESEAYLAEAQRLSHTGSWASTLATGDTRYWSDECYRVLGFDPDEGRPSFEAFLERVHPDDQAKVREMAETARRDKVAFELDYRIVHHGAEIRDIHAVGHPVLSPSGDVVEFVGTVIDITERKRADEALRRSEAYLAEAQRLTHTGSWACNMFTGELIHSSQEHSRLYGFDPEKGRPSFQDFVQRIHPEDRTRVLQAFESASRAGRDFDAHFRVVLPDGTTKYQYGTGHPLFNSSGDVSEFVGIVMDETERRRAEALREGESRILEMIARDAPQGEILETLVRVVEAQFAGLLCSVLLLGEDGQHVRHGAAPSLPESYIRAIDGLCIGPKAGSCGTAMYRREPVVVTDILQDPLWEPYRVVAESHGLRACWSTPILAHSGNALGSFAMYYREPRSPSPAEAQALKMATHLAGIAIERKQAEEELRQAQGHLAHVSRTTTMGELTASLAHEVNQPIAAAVTSASSCLRWLEGDVPNLDKARAAAMRIVKDGTRAAEIISRIRLLFQKGTPHWESVDVNEVIEEMIVLLRGEATRHSVLVRTELAPDIPLVMADRVQLQQVMMNLMMNGIDAMKAVNGTRELGIKSQHGDGEQLLVSVSDTGVGLPPQQEDQIFNAFFTTKPHGTGMGLRICRSIVESHGGRLWAANNCSSGATVSFTLGSRVEARE